MGMKGGCSPQNTLRLKHSFWRRKLNIREFYGGNRSVWSWRTTRIIAGFVGRSDNRFRGSRRPHFTSPEVAEALSESCGAGQLFDLRHDAVQLVDQRVVTIPVQSYD